MSNISAKNKSIILFFGLCAGAALGFIAWAYLRVLTKLLFFFWSWLPNQLSGLLFSVYIVIICIVGSLIVGHMHRQWGDYPKNIDDTIREIKSNKKFNYGNLHINVISAYLPLVFGGSVGPEAGLVSTLTGLFHWVSDCLRYLYEQAENGSVHILRSLRGCLRSGFLTKSVVCVRRKRSDGTYNYLPTAVVVVLGVTGLTVFILLVDFGGAQPLLARLQWERVTVRDAAFYMLLICIGILLGYYYQVLSKTFTKLFSGFKRRRMHVLNALVGGVTLAIVAQFFYISLFSGEVEMVTLIENYGAYSGLFFIVIGVVKIFLTNVCLATGWKGGNFVPIIFSGICVGYGMSLILHLGGTFSAAIVTVCALSVACGMPLVMTLMALVCMPFNTLPWMLAASFICGIFPGKCRMDIKLYIYVLKKIRGKKESKAVRQKNVTQKTDIR